jgi:PAS domain S-box-containing protein
MNMKRKISDAPKTGLRLQAEAKLSKSKKGKTSAPGTDADTSRLIHELQVRQIELEMQNEELIRARAEAEAALRLYDFAPMGYFTLARDGAIKQANLTGADMLGVEREKLIHRRLGLFVAAKSRKDFAVLLEKVFSLDGEKETCEVELLKDKTESFWAYIEAVSDAAREREACRAVVVDITKRKQAESQREAALEALHVSERRFRALIENSSDAVTLLDATGGIVYESPSSVRITGYTIEEQLGRNGFDVIHPDDRERAQSVFRILAQTPGGSANMEMRTLHKDGSYRNMDCVATNLLDDPAVQSVVVNFHDVTERKQADVALHKSEEKYRKLSEFTPNGLLIHVGGKITFANTAAAKILGPAMPGDIIGKTLIDFVHQDYRDLVTERVRQITENKDNAPVIEEKLVRLDGAVIDAEVTAIPFIYNEESAVQVVFQDITARKRAEEDYRAIFERAPVGIFRSTADGHLVKVNQAMAEMYGYPLPAEMIADVKSIATQMYVEPMLRQEFARLLAEHGEVRGFESLDRRKDGSTFWTSMSARVVKNDAGETLYYEGFITDINTRKRAEEMLKKSQSLLAETERIGKVGGWKFGFDSDTFDIDPEGQMWTEEVYRIHEVDLTYKPTVEKAINFYAPASRPVIEQAVQRAIKYGESFDMELEIITAKGNLRWVHAIGKADLKHKKVFGFFQDITERKHAEEALREVQEQLQAILDYSPALISIKDLNGNIVLANRGFALLDAPPLNEFVGKNVFDVFPKEVAEQLWNNDLAASRAGKPVYSEEVVRHKDGLWHTYFTVKFPIYLGSDQLFGTCAISNDITERKQAEKEIERLNAELKALLNESENRFRVAQDISLEAFTILRCIRNEQGQIVDFMWTYANPSAARLLGQPVEKLVGAKLLETLPGNGENESLFKRYAHIVETGQGDEVELEYRSENIDGWFRNMTVKLGDGVAVSFSDITERKQAETVLRRSHEELEQQVQVRTEEIRQLNASLKQRIEERTQELRDAQEKIIRQEKLSVLGQMAGSIGHELRNPLAVISSAVYYLKMTQPDAGDKVKEYLNLIQKNVQISDKIIGDLLNFTRIKSVEREPVLVSRLLQETLVRFPAPESIQVTLDLPADLPKVYADPQHIVQILGNLILNGCQSMSEGGELVISSHAQDSVMLCITVQDAGSGISPENLKKLFEPLFTTKSNGIGLGLAVCRNLAEANGGRIEVESEMGKGSTFTIWLPIQ